MTADANPYAAPRSQVGDVGAAAAGLQAVRVWNPPGRMGRLHYIGYSIGLSFVLAFALGLLGAMLGVIGFPEVVMVVVSGLGYLAYIALYFQLTVQRCHDLDWSGWLSILALVPLLNFIFWFLPGTRGANRWGAPPQRGGTWIAVLLVLGVVMIGILAAIAIPAYNDYVKRARATQTR
jgi:uncharacterized membrane protein YhaH (DUF805 family)